jgi:hypothetical protein
MSSEKKTPIIVFAFNRLDSLKKTIASLLNNEEAKDSDLFVFVDGARSEKKDELDAVKKVQDFVRTIKGFGNLNYEFSSQNKGLGPSIISGVTKVVNQYGKAIVLEDDLILSKNFLKFMNEGLNLYEDEKKVFSICGYSNRVKKPSGYVYDTYFCTRSSSWGWATWKDRWNSVDWKLENWENYKKYKNRFNKWGGSDCFKMLNDWRIGKNKSWAIRFCFAEFLQDKVSLFPLVSKVKNDGFDGSGTNCKKYSRFKFDFDDDNCVRFSFPQDVGVNKELYKSAMRYHSISIRLWSKVMYFLKG